MLAGADLATAFRLGLSMVLLQAAVGALNDVVDAPLDAGRKPGKPIPAGLVRPVVGRRIAVAAGVAGLVLAAPSGAATLVLAGVLLGLGVVYDLRLKGTAWSWLPFAIAIPLFPTYGWLGSAGTVPVIWALVVPTAMVAGAALAIANASVDIERDRAAGIASVATHIGRGRAWAIHVVLLGTVVLVAMASLVAGGGDGPFPAGIALAGVLLAGGAWLVRSASPARRERGWELEAVGTGLLAAVWLAGAVAAGLTGA